MPDKLEPKTSLLGWDMDHTWLLRDGTWLLTGEFRSLANGWRRVDGRVEVVGDLATYLLDPQEGPQRLIHLPTQRKNHEAYAVEVVTESVTLEGAVRTFGSRHSLSATAGRWNLSETGLLQADGSLKISGHFSRGSDVHEAWCWTLTPALDVETWTLPASVQSEMVAHAQTGSPIEQCGLLVGDPATRQILSHIPMTNVDQSEDHFTMDPREQFAAIKKLRGTGTEVVGSWHSHPFSPARLSDEDVTMAADETALYTIVSLMNSAQPCVRAFHVRDGKVFGIRLVSV